MKKCLLIFVVLFAGSAFAQQQRYIKVTWEAPAPQAGVTIVAYNVFRFSGDCGTSNSWLAIGSVTGLSYDDTNVVRSQNYCYVVRAYDGVEESVDSNTAQTFIPPPPGPPRNVQARQDKK